MNNKDRKDRNAERLELVCDRLLYWQVYSMEEKYPKLFVNWKSLSNRRYQWIIFFSFLYSFRSMYIKMVVLQYSNKVICYVTVSTK